MDMTSLIYFLHIEVFLFTNFFFIITVLLISLLKCFRKELVTTATAENYNQTGR